MIFGVKSCDGRTATVEVGDRTIVGVPVEVDHGATGVAADSRSYTSVGLDWGAFLGVEGLDADTIAALARVDDGTMCEALTEAYGDHCRDRG